MKDMVQGSRDGARKQLSAVTAHIDCWSQDQKCLSGGMSEPDRPRIEALALTLALTLIKTSY